MSQEQALDDVEVIDDQRNQTAKQRFDVKSAVNWAISIGVPLILYLAIPVGGSMTEEIRRFLALTVFALIAWALSIVPVYVSGTALTILYVLTKTASPGVVFSPWATMVPWISLGGLTLSVIFEKTGLLSRIAFWFISVTGGSYRGIVIGLTASGALVGLLVPSMTGRVVLYAALTLGIIHALKIKPNTNEAAGIMFGGFMASIACAWLFMSANDNLLIINSFLIDVGEGVSWLRYVAIMFVPAAIFIAMLVAVTLLIFRGRLEVEGREEFQNKLRELGPVKPQEIKFLVILALLVLALVFTDIAAGWLFMAAVVACFLPGIGITTADDLKQVNYMMVFFVAQTMSIGAVASELGLPKMVTDSLLPLMSGTNNYVFILMIMGFGIIINFLMTPLAGITSFGATLIELANTLGLSAPGAAFGFVWGVEQLILPYEWVMFLILFSYNMFDMKKAIIWSAARMGVAVIAMAAIILPYWMLVGFIS